MLTKEQKEKYMHLAFEQAKKAEEQGEVPIGAVVVDKDGNVIGEGYNRRELDEDATQHAEMIAIEQANQALGNWRLEDCELFVTLEPCPMCAGAIVLSRVKRVIFGAHDPKGGCCGTLMNLVQDERFNHQAEVTENVLAEECGELLTVFFRSPAVPSRWFWYAPLYLCLGYLTDEVCRRIAATSTLRESAPLRSRRIRSCVSGISSRIPINSEAKMPS